MFVIRPFEEGSDGFRHRARAGRVHRVARPNGVEALGEIVAVPRFDSAFNRRLVRALTREEDADGDGLGALDPLRMVVGHLGCGLCEGFGLLNGTGNPADGRDPHGAAVAETVVGLRVLGVKPLAEIAAVASVRVGLPHGLHVANHRFFQHRLVLSVRFDDGLCDGEGHDRVVGEPRAVGEQRKIHRLHRTALVDGAGDVAEYCT